MYTSGVRGGAGRYSHGASSALTQIVPYSSSLYTVFHSVIYNSVDIANCDDVRSAWLERCRVVNLEAILERDICIVID